MNVRRLEELEDLDEDLRRKFVQLGHLVELLQFWKFRD
jgi:hypothetical protein